MNVQVIVRKDGETYVMSNRNCAEVLLLSIIDGMVQNLRTKQVLTYMRMLANVVPEHDAAFKAKEPVQ